MCLHSASILQKPVDTKTRAILLLYMKIIGFQSEFTPSCGVALFCKNYQNGRARIYSPKNSLKAPYFMASSQIFTNEDKRPPLIYSEKRRLVQSLDRYPGSHRAKKPCCAGLTVRACWSHARRDTGVAEKMIRRFCRSDVLAPRASV